MNEGGLVWQSGRFQRGRPLCISARDADGSFSTEFSYPGFGRLTVSIIYLTFLPIANAPADIRRSFRSEF
jgi:hypothetical protein